LKGGIDAFYRGRGYEGLYFCLVGDREEICGEFDYKNLSGEVDFLAENSAV